LRTYVAWLSIVDQCTQCSASLRVGVNYATMAEVENINIINMSLFDCVSLALASLIVALTMMREIRDINIGQMMTMQALDRLSEKRRALKKADCGPVGNGPTCTRTEMQEMDEISEISENSEQAVTPISTVAQGTCAADEVYELSEYNWLWRSFPRSQNQLLLTTLALRHCWLLLAAIEIRWRGANCCLRLLLAYSAGTPCLLLTTLL